MIHARKPLVALASGAILALTHGCQVGPSWDAPLEISRPLADVSGKTVVVSNFLSAVSTESVSVSADIQYIMSSARVHDISLVIAEALQKRGIDAEARLGATPDDLGEDQVLLSGAVTASPWQSGGHLAANLLLFPFSLTLVGGVVPSPVPYREGGRVGYRVQLVDSEGRILLQTGDRSTHGYFDDYWIWGSLATQDEAPDLVAREAQRLLADEIAAKLAPGASQHSLAAGARSSADV